MRFKTQTSRLEGEPALLLKFSRKIWMYSHELEVRQDKRYRKERPKRYIRRQDNAVLCEIKRKQEATKTRGIAFPQNSKRSTHSQRYKLYNNPSYPKDTAWKEKIPSFFSLSARTRERLHHQCSVQSVFERRNFPILFSFRRFDFKEIY